MKFDKKKTITILKRIGFYSFIIFCAICSFTMVLSSYSGMFPPQDYPLLSVLTLTFPFFLFLNILLAIILLFVNKKWAIMPATAMLLCITDIRAFIPFNFGGSAPDNAIKVMSFNIGRLEKDKNDQLLDYLEQTNADICCLQEFYPLWDESYQKRLEQMYPYSYIDTLYKYSKRTICLSKYEIIPNSETVLFEKKSGNGAISVKVKIGNDTLLLVNSHLHSYSLGEKVLNEYKDITGENISMAERKNNTLDIISKIQAGNMQRGPQVDTVYNYLESNLQKYTLLCGDLNEPTMSYSHYKFTKLLKDAFTRSGNGFGFSYSRNKIRYRIDHILCSTDITPYEAVVDKTCELSDHFPVICYLKLE